MNINDLNNILIKYIEDNKCKYNINYQATIDTIQELLNEIKREYEEIDNE